MSCYTAYSNIPDLFKQGSCGGVVTTLAFIAIKSHFVDGFVTLDRTLNKWQIACNIQDLKRACGSTYHIVPTLSEFLKNHSVQGMKYGLIGKPCDMTNGFAPLLSLFCARAWTIPVTKETMPSQTGSVLKMPLRCSRFLCKDHVGKMADISVGDSQMEKKLNVVLVRTKLGQWLLDLCINLKCVSVTKIDYYSIKERQPYLWR